MIKHRRRFKRTQTFKDRLREFAKVAREMAIHRPVGPERDDLIERAGRGVDQLARLAATYEILDRVSRAFNLRKRHRSTEISPIAL